MNQNNYGGIEVQSKVWVNNWICWW